MASTATNPPSTTIRNRSASPVDAATTTTPSSKMAAATPLATSAPVDKTKWTHHCPTGTETSTHQRGHRFAVPQFTIKQLLDAIPAHCFERSALQSTRYVIQDFIIVAIFAKAAWHINDLLSYLALPYWPNLALKVALWNFYWFAQGCIGFGLWIIGHECGHGAFSENKTYNDIVGLVLHSIWMVPYHSWRISHGKHHAACGHHERDEVFVARTRSECGYPKLDLQREDLLGLEVTEDRQEEMHSAISEAVSDAPIVVLGRLILHQVFGLPLYLILNASGQLKHGHMDHFRPMNNKLFKSRDFWDVVVSDIGIATVIGTMVYWANMRGWQEMVAMWMIPYMWVNHWLVLVTFLQHSDPIIPHYSAKEWTFARGALTTVDRNILGFVGPWMMHGIAETHIAHHLSSRIPHYKAWEATMHLREILGEHYTFCNENVYVSLWKNFRSCQFVEDTGDIRFFKDKRGLAQTFPAFLGDDAKGGAVSDSGVEMEEPLEEFYPDRHVSKDE